MTKNKGLQIQKTSVLWQLLSTLLKGNPFNKITVNDVCTEALWPRAFMLILDNTTCWFVWKFSKEFTRGIRRVPFNHIRNVLKKIQKDIIVFKNLMMINLDMGLAEIIRNSFLEDLERNLKLCPKAFPLPGPVEIIAVYCSSAITNTIMYWVSKNMPYTIDEMANA